MCQFKDDCEDATDCGSSGECVDFGATNYPRRQCFCEPGFFGINCEKISVLDSNIYDEADYTKEDLGIVDFLYRFVDGELEAIVIGKETLSYVAIGNKNGPTAPSTCVGKSTQIWGRF